MQFPNKNRQIIWSHHIFAFKWLPSPIVFRSLSLKHYTNKTLSVVSVSFAFINCVVQWDIIREIYHNTPTVIYVKWLNKMVLRHNSYMYMPLLSVPLPWANGLPVAIQCAWNLDPSVHWNATGEIMLVASVFPVVFQWLSSGLPVSSNYAN